MAKASISLRLEPHELHIVKESLRVMSAMMEAMLEGKDSIENYEFNPGVYENVSLMYVDLEKLRIELGMEPPPEIRPSRAEPIRTQPERSKSNNLMRNFRDGWRAGRMARHVMRRF